MQVRYRAALRPDQRGPHSSVSRVFRARNADVAGTLDIVAKGSGTLDDPDLTFTAQIPQLQIQNQTISGVTLKADIANRVATVALDSRSAAINSTVRGRGRINLTGDFETDATFDTPAISIQPLLALYATAALLSKQKPIA